MIQAEKTYKRNDIEKIVDNDGIMWLNEKHIEKGLDHTKLRKNATKYRSYHGKPRHELDNKSKIERSRIFIDEKSAIRVIMDCRTTSAHRFRTRLELKQDDVILTKEQSFLTRIISSFEGGI